MFDWITSDRMLFVAGLILAGVQFAAALPWLWAIDPKGFERTTRSGSAMAVVLGGLVLAGAVLASLMGYKGDSSRLQQIGQYGYGAVLNLQLLIDLFLLMPAVLVKVWPKGGAVALAAYREGWRQPMFWLIIAAASCTMWFAVYIPYFTFGEDYKMMKQVGFDLVMLAALVFGVLAASMSISEEIEGRTAVTLMSKPINRRQFLVGKFLGILMACFAMSMILSWNMSFCQRVVREYDPINNNPDPTDIMAKPRDKVVDAMTLQGARVIVPAFQKVVPTQPGKTIAKGCGIWFGDAYANAFGVALGFGQVMILVAIATALATRLPFVINIVICLVIYIMGHLAPVVVHITEIAKNRGDANDFSNLVGFLGQLFDVVLPALEFFNMGPAVIREAPLDLTSFGLYVLTVAGYALLYTAVALIVGLLLFEDRDLA
ncbi:MAG TPA: ABC transporter permease [Urbifossiella sp.]|nr:ABC transporter permease [Urbifossiella sp.]